MVARTQVLAEFAAAFEEVFGSLPRARAFVDAAEAKPPANLIVHQTARMIRLAGLMANVEPDRPALQLLFLIIAAETAAKLYCGHQGEGESKRHVRKFFEDISDDRARARLGEAFAAIENFEFLSTRDSIDLLYEVRCDVVHEGRYWFFDLPIRVSDLDQGDERAMLHRDRGVIPRISVEEIRRLVLEGAVAACEKLGVEVPRQG
jgi:hypothetical protein